MHKVVVYLDKESVCKTCVRVMPYLRHISRIGNPAIRDANRISRIRNKVLRAQLYAEFEWQDQATPVVYIDGNYIELAELVARVNAWDIANKQDGDRCSKDFILGEARVG